MSGLGRGFGGESGRTVAGVRKELTPVVLAVDCYRPRS